MPSNSRYYVGVLRPLVKILESFEVGEIFLFVSVLREGDRNVFAGNPLIEVVFDLESD